ncbi:MAG: hypothetical protein QS748_01940 [Candidatus Endonucleobacter bathymodioli]|uniref:Uncharacterized protein n=1 Tax=Candidatus Endonucleibacter bathymodioli TaxID=539814 RepID=A0AA90SLP1_9GAMM|nr:hypothetical protein [Candidatus Endonucleobacter bathymodioli]
MNIQKSLGQVSPASELGSSASSLKRTNSDSQFAGRGVSTNNSARNVYGPSATKQARHHAADEYMSSTEECDRQAIQKLLDQDKYDDTGVHNTSTTDNTESTVTIQDECDKKKTPAELAKCDQVIAELVSDKLGLELCTMYKSGYGEKGSVLAKLIDAYVARYGECIRPYCEGAVDYIHDIYNNKHYKPWKGPNGPKMFLDRDIGLFLDGLVKRKVHRAQNPTAIDNIASFAGSTVAATSNAVCSIASSIGWLFRR